MSDNISKSDKTQSSIKVFKKTVPTSTIAHKIKPKKNNFKIDTLFCIGICISAAVTGFSVHSLKEQHIRQLVNEVTSAKDEKDTWKNIYLKLKEQNDKTEKELEVSRKIASEAQKTLDSQVLHTPEALQERASMIPSPLDEQKNPRTESGDISSVKSEEAQGKIETEKKTKPEITDYYKRMMGMYGITFTDKNFEEKKNCYEEILELRQELDDSKGDYGEFTEKSSRINEKIGNRIKRCQMIK
jgi:hypothetical protein